MQSCATIELNTSHFGALLLTYLSFAARKRKDDVGQKILGEEIGDVCQIAIDINGKIWKIGSNLFSN